MYYFGPLQTSLLGNPLLAAIEPSAGGNATRGLRRVGNSHQTVDTNSDSTLSGDGKKKGATPLVLSQAFSRLSQSSLINLIQFA
jgi:hypothetical protein